MHILYKHPFLYVVGSCFGNQPSPNSKMIGSEGQESSIVTDEPFNVGPLHEGTIVGDDRAQGVRFQRPVHVDAKPRCRG